MTDTQTPFDRIEAKRAERKWSQREACRQAGLNESALANAKRNDGRLDLDTVEAFAAAFDCPVSELLGEAPSTIFAETSASPVQGISLARISPSPLNPRKTFDDAALADLAESIAAQGLLQNLVVRPDGDRFVLISGERRWRALSKLADLGRLPADLAEGGIPCRVIQADDAQHLALALLENLQRQDVNAMEEAEAFAQLQALDPATYTTTAIAERLGKTGKGGQRYIQQRLALVEKLIPEVQEALRKGKISFTQARQLTMAPIPAQMAATKRLGEFKSAEQIQAFVLKDMIPAAKAFFDLAGSGLDVVEDPADGALYVVDGKKFKARQKQAAMDKVQELKGEWAWAEYTTWFSAYDYLDERSEDRAVAGAVVVHSDYENKVTVHTGLVKRPKADGRDYEAERREREAEQNARALIMAPLQRQLKEAIAVDPMAAMRLAILIPGLSGSRGLESRFHGYGKQAINGGCLSLFAGLVGPEGFNGHKFAEGRDVEALTKIMGLSDKAAGTAFAGMIAEMVVIDPRRERLTPLQLALLNHYQIEIPAELLPSPLEQLQERVENGLDTAADVAALVVDGIRVVKGLDADAAIADDAELATFDLDASAFVSEIFDLHDDPTEIGTVADLVGWICRAFEIEDPASVAGRVRRVLRGRLGWDEAAGPDDELDLEGDLELDPAAAYDLAYAFKDEFGLPRAPFIPDPTADVGFEKLGIETVGALITHVESRVANLAKQEAA